MNDRRRGLGRGLGALIPSAPTAPSAPSTEPQETGSTSPTAVPTVLPSDRGAAAKAVGVASGQPPASTGEEPNPGDDVSRETSSPGDQIEGQAGDQSGNQAETVPDAYFAEVPVDSVRPNPRQPREYFDEDALAELVTSVREVGLLQPIVVRPVSAQIPQQGGAEAAVAGTAGTSGAAAPEQYELIMGERRWRACMEAGLSHVPAIVRAIEDQQLLLDALLENLHRAELNPLEEAAAYDQLLRDFSCTHEELADRIGRSRAQVSNTLRLLRLTPEVQPKVASGVLSAGHARALLGCEEPEAQRHLAHRIVAEGLSVRTVEELVRMEADDGAPTKKTTKPRPGRRLAPDLEELSTRLSDRFETRVKVDIGRNKGKIVVEFASVEDLNRILDSLAPGESSAMGRGGDSGRDAGDANDARFGES